MHNHKENPFIYRITEIQDTVTKGKRVPFVANRLRKCFTRGGYCQWHCVMGVILAILLGTLFYDLPSTRAGIEKRENLFRIIVLIHCLHHVVRYLHVRGNLIQSF